MGQLSNSPGDHRSSGAEPAVDIDGDMAEALRRALAASLEHPAGGAAARPEMETLVEHLNSRRLTSADIAFIDEIEEEIVDAFVCGAIGHLDTFHNAVSTGVTVGPLRRLLMQTAHYCRELLTTSQNIGVNLEALATSLTKGGDIGELCRGLALALEQSRGKLGEVDLDLDDSVLTARRIEDEDDEAAEEAFGLSAIQEWEKSFEASRDQSADDPLDSASWNPTESRFESILEQLRNRTIGAQEAAILSENAEEFSVALIMAAHERLFVLYQSASVRALPQNLGIIEMLGKAADLLAMRQEIYDNGLPDFDE
jgi:hypothetical protein